MRYENILVMRHQTRPQLGRTELQTLQIRSRSLDRLFLLLLLLSLRRAGELLAHVFYVWTCECAE